MSTQGVDVNALFQSLDDEGLQRVARSARTDIEDVHQQALMICAEIAAGQSTFDPLLGTLEQFVFGKLWGFAERESLFRSDNSAEDEEPEESHLSAGRDDNANPLSILLAREAEREDEQVRCAAVAAARRADPLTALELCLAAGAAGAQTAQAMGRHRATGWRKRREALAATARLLGVQATPDATSGWRLP
ncbi:MAG: hypothetical protein KGL42_17690 [Betaproteobacteria bacterium]|nr:hypothetical protein [Betaproteobacteria bacterium]